MSLNLRAKEASFKKKPQRLHRKSLFMTTVETCWLLKQNGNNMYEKSHKGKHKHTVDQDRILSKYNKPK